MIHIHTHIKVGVGYQRGFWQRCCRLLISIAFTTLNNLLPTTEPNYIYKFSRNKRQWLLTGKTDDNENIARRRSKILNKKVK